MGPIGLWASRWFWPKSVIAAPAATPPDCVVSLSMLPVSVTLSFLWSRVVSPASDPQPGGPAGHFLSGLYPLTCSAWVTLPGVQDSHQHSSRGH